MDKAKYIIIIERGHEVPIIFSSLIDHCTIANGIAVVSAGFCAVWGTEPTDTNLDTIIVTVWGRSITLKNEKNRYVVSRPEDANIIKKMLYDTN